MRSTVTGRKLHEAKKLRGKTRVTTETKQKKKKKWVEGDVAGGGGGAVGGHTPKNRHSKFLTRKRGLYEKQEAFYSEGRKKVRGGGWGWCDMCTNGEKNLIRYSRIHPEIKREHILTRIEKKRGHVKKNVGKRILIGADSYTIKKGNSHNIIGEGSSAHRGREGVNSSKKKKKTNNENNENQHQEGQSSMQNGRRWEKKAET